MRLRLGRRRRSGTLSAWERYPAFVVLAAAVGLAPAASAVTIDWVTVAGPGNAADTTGFGSVASVYRISKYEVTNAQYAEFLNAVAASDPNGLYNTRMGTNFTGGITRSGGSGSYTYSAIAGREGMPVNFVSFYDALRYANWLHNGQPVGAQGSATTEDGAYTITALGIDTNSITRNAGAVVFLPSEDEWYKAAYYDADSSIYFDFPAGTDTATVCAVPGATGNTANCNNAIGDLSKVGSYTGSASPSGTFDQGGNVWEWNEAIVSGSARGLRGGSYNYFSLSLWASWSWSSDPLYEGNLAERVGFRVASVPEPGSSVLVMMGMLLLAIGRRRSIHRQAAQPAWAGACGGAALARTGPAHAHCEHR